MSATRVLRSMSELSHWAMEMRRPVYLTVGFFDGVHRGHRHLIEQLRRCAQLCSSSPVEALSLAVTFSNSPKNYHRLEAAGEAARGQNFPNWHYLNTAEEKLHLLQQLDLDAVLMLDYGPDTAGQSAEQWLRGMDSALRGDGTGAGLAGLVLGYDTSLGHDMLGGQAGCQHLSGRLNIDCHLVEPFDALGQHVKSSRIRQMLVRGDLDGARALLGYRYFSLGTVAHGKGKGREMLGIPTANLYLPDDKLTPPGGVYAGLAEFEGHCFPAALCLVSTVLASQTVLEREAVPAGPRELLRELAEPLLLEQDRPEEHGRSQVLEAHLIGWEGDLYGRELKLSFLQQLRGWQDFDSGEALKAQMRLDISDSIAVAYRAGIPCLVKR
ncbi:hypothetical protein IT575_07175 [bacterium]|nr:hypothetical protein [bacterium]